MVPIENILFASEMVGAVRGIDPMTGHDFDDTKKYLDKVGWLSAEDRAKIFAGNALRVYPRLAGRLKAVGLSARRRLSKPSDKAERIVAAMPRQDQSVHAARRLCRSRRR